MYKLKKTTFTTQQLSIKTNNIKPGNFKLNPSITRRTGKIRDKVFFTSLTLAIKNTEEHPFPVDVFVDFRGIFEFSEYDTELDVQDFLKLEAVKIMFPYLRSIVSNLSTTAMLPPIILPVTDVTKLFKDQTDNVYIN